MDEVKPDIYYGDPTEIVADEDAFYRSTVLAAIDEVRDSYRAERRRASGYDQAEDAFYGGAEQALRVLRSRFVRGPDAD